jgi:hypothetical protein
MPGGIGPDDESIDFQAYLDRLQEQSLQFEPGSAYGYSNTGYSLLGMIVEKVSGKVMKNFCVKSCSCLPEWKRPGTFCPTGIQTGWP